MSITKNCFFFVFLLVKATNEEIMDRKESGEDIIQMSEE
jgi:hypothetical protein